MLCIQSRAFFLYFEGFIRVLRHYEESLLLSLHYAVIPLCQDVRPRKDRHLDFIMAHQSQPWESPDYTASQLDTIQGWADEIYEQVQASPDYTASQLDNIQGWADEIYEQVQASPDYTPSQLETIKTWEDEAYEKVSTLKKKLKLLFNFYLIF